MPQNPPESGPRKEFDVNPSPHNRTEKRFSSREIFLAKMREYHMIQTMGGPEYWERLFD
jgi:hypothetical protein